MIEIDDTLQQNGGSSTSNPIVWQFYNGYNNDGIVVQSGPDDSSFYFWRVVFTSQTQEWKYFRRDHGSTYMLAVNQVNQPIYKNIDVPYIDQYRWDGNQWVMKYGWCGRASQAMVIAYFERNKAKKIVQITPDYHSKFLQNHQLKLSTIKSLTGQNNYVGSKEANTSKYKILKSIYNGNPVIVYTSGIYTYQHIFVLKGYDPTSNNFIANDTFDFAPDGKGGPCNTEGN